MNDRSLEYLSLTKLFAYAFVFIALCGALIAFLIMPILEDYRASVAELGSQNAINAAAQEQFEAARSRLQDYETANKAVLSQFEADFNATNLVKFLNDYFFEPRLKELKIDLKNEPDANSREYLRHKFEVSAVMDDPKYFYAFVEQLKDFTNLVKIEMPVDFRSNQSGQIDLKFVLKIYSANGD